MNHDEFSVSCPMILPSRANTGVHWSKVKKQRSEVRILLRALGSAPVVRPGAVVDCVRRAPSSGLDDDNLAYAFKAIRDEVAQYLGVNDKHAHIVKYNYHQLRGAYGVALKFTNGPK